MCPPSVLYLHFSGAIESYRHITLIVFYFVKYHKNNRKPFQIQNHTHHDLYKTKLYSVHFPVPLMQFPENDVFIDPIALVFVLDRLNMWRALLALTMLMLELEMFGWMCVGVKGATADNRNNFMWTRSQGNHFSIFQWNFPQNEKKNGHTEKSVCDTASFSVLIHLDLDKCDSIQK